MKRHSRESIARRRACAGASALSAEVERIGLVLRDGEPPDTTPLILLAGQLVAALARLEAEHNCEMEPK